MLYDTSKVSYETLLNVFWHQINPTTPNQQFVDKGPQYRSAVFYHTPDQKAAAVRAAAMRRQSHAACLPAAHGACVLMQQPGNVCVCVVGCRRRPSTRCSAAASSARACRS